MKTITVIYPNGSTEDVSVPDETTHETFVNEKFGSAYDAFVDHGGRIDGFAAQPTGETDEERAAREAAEAKAAADALAEKEAAEFAAFKAQADAAAQQETTNPQA